MCIFKHSAFFTCTQFVEFFFFCSGEWGFVRFSCNYFCSWYKIYIYSLSLVTISITFVEFKNKNTNWNSRYIWRGKIKKFPVWQWEIVSEFKHFFLLHKLMYNRKIWHTGISVIFRGVLQNYFSIDNHVHVATIVPFAMPNPHRLFMTIYFNSNFFHRWYN